MYTTSKKSSESTVDPNCRGAFGKVLRAVNKETNESVAIKMIQKKDLDQHELQSVLIEIKVTSSVSPGLTQIEHPNVVKMIEVFESPVAYFVVFEIMNGGEVD